MKKLLTNWTIIILTILLIPLVVFSVCYYSNTDFRYNLIAGLVSTIAGLIVGIPIALRLNHIQEQTDLQKINNENEKRKYQIIKLIDEELLYNKRQLTYRQPNETNMDRVVNVEFLKDEIWNAFSDGGELNYINDPELLSLIANAYYNIRIIKYLEDKYFESVHFPGLMVNQESPPNKRILNYLKQIDLDVLKSIDLCLEKLRVLINN